MTEERRKKLFEGGVILEESCRSDCILVLIILLINSITMVCLINLK